MARSSKPLAVAGSVLRYAWASPVSVLGLFFAAVAKASGGSIRLMAGVVEAEGGLVTFVLNRIIPSFPIAAIAVGHVVLGTDPGTLAATRRHERVHVSQYARWGLLLPVLYVASSLLALSRGGSAYHDNRFEREAAVEDSPHRQVV
jgi:hypothetical protein